MPALSTPDTIAGPLTAADLDRATKPGNVWLMPSRAAVASRDTCNGQCETRTGCDCTPLLPHGCDDQGRHKTRRFGQQAEFAETMPTDHAPQAAEACTDIGADDCRQPFTRLGVALVMLPWVLGVIGWAVWTRWPLF